VSCLTEKVEFERVFTLKMQSKVSIAKKTKNSKEYLKKEIKGKLLSVLEKE
jgi:hypothetical protein